MNRNLPVVLVLSAILGCNPPPSDGDSPAPPAATGGTAAPEHASLLRRLAEAADGYRDGRPRFVVAGRRFPHPVAGVFEDAEQADSVVRLLGADTMNYEVFGPYRAVEDPPQAVERDEEVAKVIVITRGDDTTTFDGGEVDALFWSLPAFDKFIAPYLTSVGGPRYAAAQRDLYREGKSPLARSATVPHYRNSF